ncbi:MAG: Enoyl-CoA hydratase [Polaromonas sp.]|nr:Enoyl-CoA hydratase [Polaromonas sp.]
MTDPAASVIYSVANGVAQICLNRPQLLNALNEEALLRLQALFDEARRDDRVRAVLLSAAGRAFCAGAELDGNASAPDVGDMMRRLYNPLILGMRQLPKPVVVAVNGAAAGSGLGLALAGDIVLASRSASFYAAFSRVGLVPDAGCTFFLPRMMGDARSRAMFMLAEKLSADDAHRLGLVWKVIEADALMAEAVETAERLARMPTRALALIKQTLESGAGATLADQLDTEATCQTEAARTADHAEGVAAFLEKRAPVFLGL